ncbi:TPA: helix-turn-helix domain-containing protein [Clostridioides difficile]|uniref:helix-turn-helix domain-containing protein n=1 Tax=Clostridioides difficile TaxID=1496 RepID=UPI0010284865|nr:helix-turn-helix domain-containing protein [Clostridioides difficile]MBH7626260.1 helix-turn-helix domain-containing protein [Clostridioides difficile]MBY2541734.1 helix-turn-helix domain-containing protein [Clostridioides difficile]MDB0373229.1 XRE family transcriptional regulator [Clostridioides difficile]MDB2859137.1 XRE family transcriptional regulator [Clostridioides difficile]MDV5911819.1 helix-turn-helix domain-containing protein [Clostridioides difficile]
MNIQINELLKSKGKSKYWLSKQTGMTQQNMGKLASGQTTSIKFELLEKICLALECTPNDVLGWKSDK